MTSQSAPLNVRSSSLGVTWHPMVVPIVVRPTTLSELPTSFAPLTLPLFGWVSSLELMLPQSCLKIPHLPSSPIWIRSDLVTSNLLLKNNNLCQAGLTVLESPIEPFLTQAAQPSPTFIAPLSSTVTSVHVHPDGLLYSSEKVALISLLEEFQLVFDSRIPS